VDQRPQGVRESAAQIARAAFTISLNRILLAGVIIALAGGMICIVAIRRQDFDQH
jgi:hypothetical protein